MASQKWRSIIDNWPTDEQDIVALKAHVTEMAALPHPSNQRTTLGEHAAFATIVKALNHLIVRKSIDEIAFFLRGIVRDHLTELRFRQLFNAITIDDDPAQRLIRDAVGPPDSELTRYIDVLVVLSYDHHAGPPSSEMISVPEGTTPGRISEDFFELQEVHPSQVQISEQDPLLPVQEDVLVMHVRSKSYSDDISSWPVSGPALKLKAMLSSLAKRPLDSSPTKTWEGTAEFGLIVTEFTKMLTSQRTPAPTRGSKKVLDLETPAKCCDILQCLRDTFEENPSIQPPMLLEDIKDYLRW